MTRAHYFDYLKIFSAIAVIFIHVCASCWHVDSLNIDWYITNFYDSIVRFAVPVFVMISGALFIQKETTLKSLFKKNISRLFVCFCFWSCFYALSYPIIEKILYNTPINIKNIISQAIYGHYHMWFIPMIIGLYLCLPIFQKICESKKVMTYYLLLSFVFAFILPEMFNLANDFTTGKIHTLFTLLGNFPSNMNMSLSTVLGFGFYFVLGYYLNTTEIDGKKRKILYIFGIIGFIFTIGISGFVSYLKQAPNETYYLNFNVNIMFEAILVFLLFKNANYSHVTINNIAESLSKLSLGVYLIHPFIITAFAYIGLKPSIFCTGISIPLIVFAVSIVSFAIIFAISKIPFLKKWII